MAGVRVPAQVRIRIVGENRGPQLWLESFEDSPDGRGRAVITPHRERAMVFDSFAQAFDYWRQESKFQPLRSDGKPNRPLTAYTVEIV